LNTIPNCP